MDIVKNIKKSLPIVFILLFFSLLFFNLLSSRMLRPEEGNWYSGGSTWGDLAFHLSLISSFTWGNNTLFHWNPVFLGEKLSYPFFSDLISGLLVKLGLNLRWSLIIPSLIFLGILVVLIYLLTLKITKSKLSALLTPFIFFFNGSIFGLYYFWQDFKQSSGGFSHFLNHLTKEYAHLGEFNLHFSNIICDFLLPQRPIILGLVFGVSIIYFFWLYWEKKERKSLFKAGLIASFLPIIHTHTFLAMMILAGIFVLIQLIENIKDFRNIFISWLYFSLPIIAIALPQILLIYPFDKEGFFQLKFGWMKGQEGILEFWLKNLGIHSVLFIVAFITARKRLKLFYLPFLGLFVFSNLMIFQPHSYDNMKIMIFWFFLSCILIANLFQQILKRLHLKGLFIIIPLFFLLIATGALSVYRESYTKWMMFSDKDIAAAEFVKESTPPNSIFLTSDKHNHFIPCLTGRKILMGYRGWLWTYGIKYGERERDVVNMFSGNSQTKGLLEKYNVDYAIISNSEKAGFYANESFYEKNYPLIYQLGDIKIYKTK